MKEKIHAVSNNDIEGLIESLGIGQKLEDNLMKCSCCGKIITKDDIGCFYPIGRSAVFATDRTPG